MNKNNFRLRDPVVLKHKQKIGHPKKRMKLPPSIQNLRCELELLSAGLAIAILTIMPDLANWIKKLLSSNYGMEISSYGNLVFYEILLSGFVLFVVLRSLFLLINKKNTAPPPQKNADNSFLDFFCEILFYSGMILLFVFMVGYLIQISGVLLRHFVSLKMKTIPGISG